MNTINSLRLRALALRSSIHNEHQLSAIELTAMCAKKTNELIDVVNELCEFIEGLQTGSIKVTYDEANESLIIGGADNG